MDRHATPSVLPQKPDLQGPLRTINFAPPSTSIAIISRRPPPSTRPRPQVVDELEATGGTAINDALLAPWTIGPKDDGRSFNIVFFTTAPTIGETNVEKIMRTP